MATVFPLLGETTRMEGEAVEAEAEGRDKRQSKVAESVEGTTSTSFQS